MWVKKVSVQNFRCHDEKTVEFTSGVNIIVGENGIGKTSILEAIYEGLLGTSFKTKDSEILKHDKEWWRADLHLDNDTERTVTFNASTGKKEFTVAEKKMLRLSPKVKYPVTIFEPDDTLLIQGSPESRRRFLDDLISKIEPSFNSTLRKYEKAVTQRNKLLKNGIENEAEYFPWNIIISEYGAAIIARRERIINLINDELPRKYQDIAQNKDSVHLHNPYPSETYDATQLLNELEDNFRRDLLLKSTKTGPHRHDVHFLLNDVDARDKASRGEIRTIVLALKQAEISIIKEVTDNYPIVLLDDVYSELDDKRQQQLVYGASQCIITSTHPVDVPGGTIINF